MAVNERHAKRAPALQEPQSATEASILQPPHSYSSYCCAVLPRSAKAQLQCRRSCSAAALTNDPQRATAFRFWMATTKLRDAAFCTWILRGHA